MCPPASPCVPLPICFPLPPATLPSVVQAIEELRELNEMGTSFAAAVQLDHLHAEGLHPTGCPKLGAGIEGTRRRRLISAGSMGLASPLGGVGHMRGAAVERYIANASSENSPGEAADQAGAPKDRQRMERELLQAAQERPHARGTKEPKAFLKGILW